MKECRREAGNSVDSIFSQKKGRVMKPTKNEKRGHLFRKPLLYGNREIISRKEA
jgi:hypothetical protein